jgi:hypothetical protein
MKKALGFFLAFIIITATGCFEMSEELWLNADGTGRVLIQLKVSEGLLAMANDGDDAGTDEHLKEAENELASDPDVEDVSTKEFSEAGMRHFEFDILVKDYLKIPEIYKRISESSETNSAFGAEFKLVDLGKGKVRFRQHYTGEGSEDEDAEYDEAGEELGKAMAAAMFADKYITVTVHAPKIDSSNGIINEDKDTVTWKLPLVEMMTQNSYEKVLEADLNCSGSFGDRIKKIFK